MQLIKPKAHKIFLLFIRPQSLPFYQPYNLISYASSIHKQHLRRSIISYSQNKLTKQFRSHFSIYRLIRLIPAVQHVVTPNLALYTLTASYKQFSSSFVLAINDPYLSAFRAYLSENYGTYLNQGSLISGFRQFNNYENSIYYQLLYKTIYETFNAILNYYPDNDSLLLKSLSVTNFLILEIDISNCQIKD